MAGSRRACWHWQSGLRVRSPWEIPEWPCCSPAQDDIPDVEIFILHGAPPAGWETLEKYDYRFQVPEVGSFLVEGGRRIYAALETTAVPQDVRSFLIGTAWAAVACQRHLLLLHGSSVELRSGAILCCGTSGAGKSTLAAAFMRAGARLIADDLCRCDVRPEGAVEVYPGSRRMKLWRDSVEHLALTDAVLGPDAYRPDKFHLAVPESTALEAVSLKAICLLAEGPSLSITPLAGRVALRAFVEAATFRAQVITQLAGEARHWTQCLAVLRHVPVWRIQRPKDAEVMDVAGAITAAVDSLP